MVEIKPADSDTWNIAEGNANGKPSLIRYRPELGELIGSPNYPQRLIIFWDYKQTDDSGMPSNTQLDEMKIFEDAIVDPLDVDRLAIFVYSFTNAGTREWHFYTGNIEKVGVIINSVLSRHDKFPIELQVYQDTDWSELKKVYEICK
jgi:hypothetical protein